MIAASFVVSWIADVCDGHGGSGRLCLPFRTIRCSTFRWRDRREAALFGETNIARRTPRKDVEAGAACAGLSLHFAGTFMWRASRAAGSGDRSLTNMRSRRS